MNYYTFVNLLSIITLCGVLFTACVLFAKFAQGDFFITNIKMSPIDFTCIKEYQIQC